MMVLLTMAVVVIVVFYCIPGNPGQNLIFNICATADKTKNSGLDKSYPHLIDTSYKKIVCNLQKDISTLIRQHLKRHGIINSLM